MAKNGHKETTIAFTVFTKDDGEYYVAFTLAEVQRKLSKNYRFHIFAKKPIGFTICAKIAQK